ncbi:hypothetical protein PoB_003976500 [Plakobranchus ocellatus]|uniref:Uncharacterized protein n=1 Tax=Plakobranchus ocellatus TaxID=259542 RepID=A0AAV4B2G7_9GAST|nr:hypothetical protein PoB_003976500 [Plakobranchus ocellatus]
MYYTNTKAGEGGDHHVSEMCAPLRKLVRGLLKAALSSVWRCVGSRAPGSVQGLNIEESGAAPGSVQGPNVKNTRDVLEEDQNSHAEASGGVGVNEVAQDVTIEETVTKGVDEVIEGANVESINLVGGIFLKFRTFKKLQDFVSMEKMKEEYAAVPLHKAAQPPLSPNRKSRR